MSFKNNFNVQGGVKWRAGPLNASVSSQEKANYATASHNSLILNSPAYEYANKIVDDVISAKNAEGDPYTEMRYLEDAREADETVASIARYGNDRNTLNQTQRVENAINEMESRVGYNQYRPYTTLQRISQSPALSYLNTRIAMQRLANREEPYSKPVFSISKATIKPLNKPLNF